MREEEKNLRVTYSDATVAADDGDVDRGRKGEVSEDLSDERPCADNVEGSHAEDPSAAEFRKAHSLFKRALTSWG